LYDPAGYVAGLPVILWLGVLLFHESRDDFVNECHVVNVKLKDIDDTKKKFFAIFNIKLIEQLHYHNESNIVLTRASEDLAHQWGNGTNGILCLRRSGQRVIVCHTSTIQISREYLLNFEKS